MIKRFFFLFFLLFILYPNLSFARLNVSITNDPATYKILDTLTSFGLFDDVLLGQRPYSETEVARLIEEAKKNIDRLKGSSIEPQARMLIRQIEDFLPEPGPEKKFVLVPLHSFSVEYLFLDSPYRPVPPVVSSSYISALINPFVAYRGGRPYQDNQNTVWESSHRIHFAPYFDISGQPQFFFEKAADNNQDVMQWNYDHLYLRSEFSNIGIQFGRDQLIWGIDPEGGSVLSIDARGIDMFKISNVSPFKLPWIFKYLGKMNATFYFGDLGADTNFPYSYITGYKLSFLPHRNLEWAFTTSLISGGYGAPSSTITGRVVDTFMGYIPNMLGGTNPIDSFASNRVGAFEMLWRIPKWRGTQIYGEFTLDDANFDQLHFVNESVVRGGLYFPRLDEEGRHSLRLEYKNSGWFAYRHEQFIDGWTRYQLLLGDAIGPDAQGAYIRYSFSPTYYWEQQINLAWEESSSDNYYIPTTGSQRQTEWNPTENRFRGVTQMRWRINPMFGINLSAGYERVEQFNFVPGSDRNNFLANLKLTLYPKEESKTFIPKRNRPD